MQIFASFKNAFHPRDASQQLVHKTIYYRSGESFALNYGLHNRPRLDMTIIFCSRLALCCFRIANCCFLADKLWMATGNSFWIIFVNEFLSQLVAVSTHAASTRFLRMNSRYSLFMISKRVRPSIEVNDAVMLPISISRHNGNDNLKWWKLCLMKMFSMLDGMLDGIIC